MIKICCSVECPMTDPYSPLYKPFTDCTCPTRRRLQSKLHSCAVFFGTAVYMCVGDVCLVKRLNMDFHKLAKLAPAFFKYCRGILSLYKKLFRNEAKL